MLPVPGHKLRRQETEFCEQPCQNRNFERDSHHQAQHGQCINIRIYRNGVFHFRTHLIESQKTEGKGKYQEIAEQYTQEKQYISPGNDSHRIALFVFVQGR